MSSGPAADQVVEGIDFVANNAEISGGEIMLVRMAASARDLGVDVRIVGPDFNDAIGDAATKLGLPFVAVPGRDRRAYAVQLAALSRTWRTRLVWCNGLVPALATATCRARRVVHLHQLPTKRQCRAVKLVARHAVAVVVPSEFMRRHLGAERVPAGRVLENWTEDASLTSRLVLRSRPVAIGFIGRLAPIKGIDVLADAMIILEHRRSGGCRLLIAGDARFVSPEDAALVRSHVDRCRPPADVRGWVDPEQVFADIDVVVVPSVWEEPFGLVAAQAMARGVPLVVTDAGALPDIVGPGYPWIAPPGDAVALADVIEEVMADASRARAQAAASRERWEQRFSPASGRRRFARLLQETGVSVDSVGGAEADLGCGVGSAPRRA